ncbi:hypothetical protein [Neobacillus drentensis]|uniref:hypothetical protein n=1 Tax=Neobacillus drentensis TaxID=220684 RepID=UPI002FFD7A3E
MKPFTIETITIPYQREELMAWKSRDPLVVPSFVLDWKGPGVSNGYGYGEWKAEQYFRNQGCYVLNTQFNLLSKKSKFDRFNHCISSLIGPSKVEKFKRTVQDFIQQGYTIENPDLFVFNMEGQFFSEVKKGKDILREPQIHFIYLAKHILETESKQVYLSDTATEVQHQSLTVEVKIVDGHGKLL